MKLVARTQTQLSSRDVFTQMLSDEISRSHLHSPDGTQLSEDLSDVLAINPQLLSLVLDFQSSESKCTVVCGAAR